MATGATLDDLDKDLAEPSGAAGPVVLPPPTLCRRAEDIPPGSPGAPLPRAHRPALSFRGSQLVCRVCPAADVRQYTLWISSLPNQAQRLTTERQAPRESCWSSRAVSKREGADDENRPPHYPTAGSEGSLSHFPLHTKVALAFQASHALAAATTHKVTTAIALSRCHLLRTPPPATPRPPDLRTALVPLEPVEALPAQSAESAHASRRRQERQPRLWVHQRRHGRRRRLLQPQSRPAPAPLSSVQRSQPSRRFRRTRLRCWARP